METILLKRETESSLDLFLCTCVCVYFNVVFFFSFPLFDNACGFVCAYAHFESALSKYLRLFASLLLISLPFVLFVMLCFLHSHTQFSVVPELNTTIFFLEEKKTTDEKLMAPRRKRNHAYACSSSPNKMEKTFRKKWFHVNMSLWKIELFRKHWNTSFVSQNTKIEKRKYKSYWT